MENRQPNKLTMRQRTRELEIVKVAEAAGFKPWAYNEKATKHFHWLGPFEFSVHWYNPDRPSFDVGDTSTTWEPSAIALFKTAVLQQQGEGGPHGKQE